MRTPSVIGGSDGAPSPIKRLYTRSPSEDYTAFAWMCDQGHVVKDEDFDKETHMHILTPTQSPQVICLATGETVTTESGNE